MSAQTFYLPQPVRVQLHGIVPGPDREDVRALVMQELRRLPEGVLTPYGWKVEALERWRRIQG